MAADEIDRVRKRVRRKKDELAMAGKPSGGGARPFGFEPGGLTIRETEAEIIRELAGRVLAGESLGSLAADLDRRGIRTVSGRSWLPNVLRGMLLAPRVAGLRQHRGEVVGPVAWDPVLDRRTWEELQALFLTPSRRRVGAGRRLLTGLAVCGRCGVRLVSGKNNGQRAYVCRKAAGFDGCGGLTMTAEPLEELVTEAVLLRLDSPALAERLAGGHDDDRPTTNWAPCGTASTSWPTPSPPARSRAGNGYGPGRGSRLASLRSSAPCAGRAPRPPLTLATSRSGTPGPSSPWNASGRCWPPWSSG